jgi:hypothetical protein
MRTIISLSIAATFALSSGQVWAQYPSYPGGYFGPGAGNYGGSGAQSGFGGAPGAGYPGLYGGGLSPYLNLRSRNLGNSAVNYYNFVRPYTGGTFGNAIVPQNFGAAPVRQFFPNLRPIYDEDLSSQNLERDKEGVMRAEMPPAGHGAGFMNEMGYFGQTGMGRPAAAPAAARRPR